MFCFPFSIQFKEFLKLKSDLFPPRCFNLKSPSRLNSSYRQKVLWCESLHVIVQHAKVLKMSINQTILNRELTVFGWECVERSERRRCREINQQIFDRKRPGELLNFVGVLILVLKEDKADKIRLISSENAFYVGVFD